MELRVEDLAWFALLTPTDNGRYVYTCNQGHTRTSVLQQDRFQLLFQIGIHAIVDGYPREAVADFASSLERFFEFFYRFYCRSLAKLSRDESGAPLRAVGMNWDITDHIDLTQAVFEEKERLRITLHSIGDSVISTDAQARITFMNPVSRSSTRARRRCR